MMLGSFQRQRKTNYVRTIWRERTSEKYSGGDAIDLPRVLEKATSGRITTDLGQPRKTVNPEESSSGESPAGDGFAGDNPSEENGNIYTYLFAEPHSNSTFKLWLVHQQEGAPEKNAKSALVSSGEMDKKDIRAVINAWRKAAEELGLQPCGQQPRPAEQTTTAPATAVSDPQAPQPPQL